MRYSVAAAVQLRNVSFDTWVLSHGHKKPEERWLRELYPWPVFSHVDYDAKNVGKTQRITYDEADYDITVVSVHWQTQHRTFKYHIRVETDGLGWHARSFSDDFDVAATPEQLLK